MEHKMTRTAAADADGFETWQCGTCPHVSKVRWPPDWRHRVTVPGANVPHAVIRDLPEARLTVAAGLIRRQREAS
jgi:hypothetical protein